MKLKFAHENPRVAAHVFNDAELQFAIAETLHTLSLIRHGDARNNALARWATLGKRNFDWLSQFSAALFREYRKRNGTPHPLHRYGLVLSKPPKLPTNVLWTPPPG